MASDPTSREAFLTWSGGVLELAETLAAEQNLTIDFELVDMAVLEDWFDVVFYDTAAARIVKRYGAAKVVSGAPDKKRKRK